MTAIVMIFYGIAAYTIFLGSVIYAVGFVGNFVVPKSIDSGLVGNPVEAVMVNLSLLGLFAAQHSIMARHAFKRLWTRVVPKSIERSTYVLLASLTLSLLFWQWQPIPGPVWTVENRVWITVITSVFWLGWAILLISSHLIDHFELFGLAQVFATSREKALPAPVFKTPLFYRWVRHPLYLGFLLAFWATPSMSWGHLLFSIGMTAYILLGIFLEERDLVVMFGDQYRRYRRQVGMLIPWPGSDA